MTFSCREYFLRMKFVYNIHVIKKRKIEEINDIDTEFSNVYAVFFSTRVPFKSILLFVNIILNDDVVVAVVVVVVVVVSSLIVDATVELTNELMNGMS